MKTTKIIIIAVILLIVSGAIFLKYVKPKLDERKEARRLKEAGLLASASLKTAPSYSADMASVSAATPEEVKPLGAGGLPVLS